MRIYLAGPYSAPTHKERMANVFRANEAAIALIHRGHTVFVPHLSHYLDEQARLQDKHIDYETWMAQDLDFLRLCDGFLYLESSPGADRELNTAKALGLTIGYSVEDF